MSQMTQTWAEKTKTVTGGSFQADRPGRLCDQVARLREVLVASAEDREAFEKDPRGYLCSRGETVLPGVSPAEAERLGEVLERVSQGMRFVVLDSVVDESFWAAADPNNPDPQLPSVAVAVVAVAVAIANVLVNVHASANVDVTTAGGPGPSPWAGLGGEQYSVVVDESFFSSAAAASLSEAGLSENRVRVLVRTAARQQEISPAGDGTVVLAYPYHGRTLELVGRVEGAALRIMDGTLTARAAADVHA